MSFNLGSGNGPAAQMNVTPLIDVLLVLLIIFMIITPMDPHGLFTVVPQPPGKNSKPDDDSLIVLQLSQGKSEIPALSINREPVEWSALEDRLLQIYKSRHDGVLFVKGDSDIDFEYVAQVIDTAHGVNVSRVALIH